MDPVKEGLLLAPHGCETRTVADSLQISANDVGARQQFHAEPRPKACPG
jgi:hypothetical protein